MCATFAARASLAHNGFFLARATRGAVFHGALHARLDFPDQVLDFKLALDARNEAIKILLGTGILKVVERAPISQGGHERRQLQRGL